MIEGCRSPIARRPVEQRRRPPSRALSISPCSISVERRERGRARERVAAVRRAVRARRPTSSGSSRAIIAPSGMPLAMPLPASTMSGSTPKCSIAHILPGPPHPGLHLVGHEQDPVPVAELAQVAEPPLGRQDVAALAQDRLDDDRGDLRRRRRAARTGPPRGARRSPNGRVEHARQQRAEPRPVLRLARGERHAADERPWNAPMNRDDVLPAGRVARQLDRGLDRLGARSSSGSSARPRRTARSGRAPRTPPSRSAGRSRSPSSGAARSAWRWIASTTSRVGVARSTSPRSPR